MPGSLVHKLQDVVAGLWPKPIRALLLAFDASPPFVDHVVFPALLNERLQNVTILVDDISLHAGAVDAGSTRKAGVYYRLTGVRPKGGRLFHPKLICLLHEEGVHVLVGSANLTWSGWCRNLEVMDVLSFGPQGHAPPRAGAQLAEFLRGCRDVLGDLEAPDVAALLGAADAIDTACLETPEGPANGATCEILHTLTEPLLSQLTARAPAARVSTITAVSPFHDPTNLALGAFTAAYGDAKVTVIKDGLRVDDFDGASFVRLGKRVTLRETNWGEELSRPLHAKALLLAGKRDAWLVAGSANLTSPAWRHAVPEGGNVELVVVRHLAATPPTRPEKELGASALFAEVPTAAVDDPRGLVCAFESQDEREHAPALRIVQATERNQSIRVRWHAPTKKAVDDRVVVTLRSQDRQADQTYAAVCEADIWHVDIDDADQAMRAVLEDEIAVVVQVRQVVDAVVLEGTAWLQRSELLGQQPHVLVWRHQLRALTSRMSTPEEVIDGLIALIEMSRAAEDAFRETDGKGSHGPREHEPGGSHPSAEEPSEIVLLRRSLRALLTARGPKTSRAGWSSDSLRDAGDGGDEGEDEAPDDVVDGDDDVGPGERSAMLMAQKCHELVDAAREYVSRTHAPAPEQDQRRLEDVTAGVLLYGLRAVSLAARQRVLIPYDQAFADICRARRELWALAFGIDGWEAGRSQGWFPSMSSTPAWDRIADAGIRQPEHLALLIVDAAVSALLEGEPVVAPETAFVLAMLTSTDGTFPPSSVQLRVDELIIDVAASDERFTVVALSAALQPAGIADLRGWVRLARWLPFLDFADGAIEADRLAELLTEPQRRLLAPLLRSPYARKKIASVRIDTNGIMCGECDTRCATDAQSTMLNESETFTFCENCNRLIVMVDRDAPLSRAVFAADTTRESKRVARQ